ncbi:MAG TPA: tetratricopeptide repeat protein [Chitinophagales bacterium]|nr:tetratricopeptide repeat protein [Chitinophagales bacterium]
MKKPANKKPPVKNKAHPKSLPHKKQVQPKQPSSGFQWQLLIVLAVTAAAFIPALSAGFVSWDDPAYLLENKQLTTFTWQSIVNIFASGISGNYNPLPIFTFSIEKEFFGLSPFIYHLDNLLLHLICTALFYKILRMLNLSTMAAMLGALLFGIHPMRVESVAWVTERKDVLYGVFYLGAIIAYLKYITGSSSKSKWYVVMLLLAILSLFSKVQAVALPLSMVAIDFLLKRKWLSPKVLIIEKLPFWLLALAFGIINIITLKNSVALTSVTTVIHYTMLDRLAVGAYSYAVYLGKFIFPWQMMALYAYESKLPQVAYVCLVVIPIAVIAFVWWAWKNEKRNLLFGWAFFTFNIMFLLQIVGAGQAYLADRFTYIAYCGLFFIAVKFYDHAIEKNSSRRPLLNAFAFIYLGIFAVITFRQAKTWTSDETLWKHVLKYNPITIDAWKNLGFYEWKKRNNPDSALICYQKAMNIEKALSGVKSTTYNSFGRIYFDKSQAIKDPEEKKRLTLLSIENYTRSIRQDSVEGSPDKKQTAIIHVNRGVALGNIGKTDEALNDFNVTINLDPENKYGHLNRAQFYASRGEQELALADLTSALKLDATNAEIYYLRGVCERKLSRNNEALADFTSAVDLKKTDARYFLERAQTYEALGNHDAARKDALQAQQMGMKVNSGLLEQ